MRRQVRKTLNRISRKCDNATIRSLDYVFESVYKMVIENPLPEEPEYSPKSYACVVFTHALCTPLAVSAWALRQASHLTNMFNDENEHQK